MLLLSSRLRAVLILLLDGMSIRQVACRLGLSRYAVVDYVKTLYGHFEINSQGGSFAVSWPATAGM